MPKRDSFFDDRLLDENFLRHLLLILVWSLTSSLIAFGLRYLTHHESLDFSDIFLFCAFSLLVYQICDQWLIYARKELSILSDVVWEVNEIEEYIRTKFSYNPTLCVKLTEVGCFPQRVAFVDVPQNSPWVSALTPGKQVRFMRKRGFFLLFPGWERAYDIGPVWKKTTWEKTWLGNFVCSARQVPFKNAAWCDCSCPGNTVEEAYKELVQFMGRKKLPPLSEFTEEVETYNPPENDPRANVMREAAKKTSPHSPEYPEAIQEAIRKTKIEEN